MDKSRKGVGVRISSFWYLFSAQLGEQTLCVGDVLFTPSCPMPHLQSSQIKQGPPMARLEHRQAFIELNRVLVISSNVDLVVSLDSTQVQ